MGRGMAESKLGTAYVAIRATLDELDKDIEKARSKVESGLGDVGAKLGKVGAGLTAGLKVPIVAAGAAALSVGGQFDEALDTIRTATGATGDELAGLGEDTRAVFAAIPTDMATAGQAIAELHARTGQAGQGLQELAMSEIELARITGGDLATQIANTTRMFGDWGIAVTDQVPALDTLLRTHQATGIEVDSLAGKLVQFGAPLRQMGFDFEESAALIGKFEQEGVNTELVLGSLRIALGKMAKAGIEPKQGLQDLITAIQTTGSTADANALAIEAFGARAGPDMAAAIREGRFEIEGLFTTIASGETTVMGAAEATNDYAEKFTVLKNQVAEAAIPLGVTLFDAINKLMPVFEKVIGFVAGLVEKFTSLPPAVQSGILVFAGIVAAIGPVITAIAGVVTAVGTIGPAFAGISAVVGPAITAVVAAIGPIALVIAAVVAAVIAMKLAWDNNFLGIRDTVTAAVQDITAWFQTLVANASQAVAEIYTSVTGTWNEIIGFLQSINLYEIGKSIFQGLVNGITSMRDKVMDAARSIAASLPGWVKSILGIQSPSTVFEQIGLMLMAGLALGIEGGTGTTLAALSQHVSTIVSSLEHLANSVISPKAIESAKAITDPLKTIMENVAGIISGVGALRGFRAPTGIVGILKDLSSIVTEVVNEYAELANNVLYPPNVGSAKAVSDPLAEIFGNVKAIVEGVTAIGEYARQRVVDDIPAAIGRIAEAVGLVVEKLTEAAAQTGDLGGIAAIFAENAAPVMDLISKAVDALAKLPDAANAAVAVVESGGWQLPYAIRILVQHMGEAAKLVRDDLQEAARVLAENAGPVMTTIGASLDVFKRLPEIGDSAVAVIESGGWQIPYALGTLVRHMGEAALLVKVELQEAARTFADNAGPVIGIVRSGLEALTDMAVWKRVDLSVVDAAAQQLSLGIRSLVGWVSYYAKAVKVELQEAARAFAENAGPVIAIVGDGLAALADMAVWKRVDLSVADAAAQQLGIFMRSLVGWVSYYAKAVKVELGEAARTFAENAGPVIGIVKDGLQALLDTTAWEPVWEWDAIDWALQQLGSYLKMLVDWMGYYGQQIKTELQEAASTFANNAGPVIGIVKDGLESLVALGAELVVPVDLERKLTDLSAFVKVLAQEMGLAAGYVEVELQEAASVFADNAGPVLGIVADALEAMDALADEISMPADVTDKVYNIGMFIGELATQIGTIAGGVAVDLQEAARDFAENVSPVIGMLTDTVELIGELAEMKAPSESALKTLLGKAESFLQTALSKVGGMGLTVGSLIEAADAFLTKINVTLESLKTALSSLEDIGKQEAPQVGLEWVRQLYEAMRAETPVLDGQLAAIVGLFQNALLRITDGAYAAGLAFGQTLADGIRDSIGEAVAAAEELAQAVSDVLPSSDAKRGPLSHLTAQGQALPETLVKGMLRGVGMLTTAAQTLAGAALPSFDYGVAGASAQDAGGHITVNLNVARVGDDVDVEVMAYRVAEVLQWRRR